MKKKLNDKVKSGTEEILSIKTNQDFNKQKPDSNNPNQSKKQPKAKVSDKETEPKKPAHDLENDDLKVDSPLKINATSSEVFTSNLQKPAVNGIEMIPPKKNTSVQNKENSRNSIKKEV